MSDGLSVIRRVYGLTDAEPAPAAPPTPAEAAEDALLRQSIAALGALPTLSPSPQALDAVAAEAAAHAAPEAGRALGAVRFVYGLGPEPADAAVEVAVLQQSRDAADTLPAHTPDPVSLPADRPDLGAVAYVYGLGPQPADADVEVALLQQSREAVEALPVQSPSAEALASAERPDLAAVRHVYGMGPAPAGAEVEVAVLQQSRDAVDALPAQAPSEPAQSAVRDQARAATVAPVLAAYGEAEAPDASEIALLRQSASALDALPRHAPSDAALAAVMAAAAGAAGSASAATAGTAAPVRSRAADRAPADRAPVRRAQPRRRAGLFAGAATLAVALIAAIVLIQPGDNAPALDAEADLAVAEEAAPAPAAVAPAPVPAIAQAEPTPAPPAPRYATPAPAEVFAAPTPRGPAPSPAPARSRPAPQLASADLAREADLADAVAVPTAAPAETEAWEAGDDVRVLSMRLAQLREQTQGVEWDAPAVPFGAASPGAESLSEPGIQAVREGAPPASARARMRTDQTPTDR